MTKYKIIISAFLFFLVHQNVFAQVVISARINGKETEKRHVADKPLKVFVKKSDYKNVCDFDILVDQKNANHAYKRAIELTDENGGKLYSVDESKDSAGVYYIRLANVCEELSAKKIIEVMFIENPANDLLMLPSKMKQIAEIHLQ
ncbi:MAG: hypothetical protein ABIO76_11340 [Ginsengibacter sp.]